MKVFLVNLPWQRRGLWGVRAGSRWPHIKTPRERQYRPFPFFMAYAAALLKREGFEVRLIDALAEEMPMSRLLTMIRDERPDLILAETSTPSLSHDLSMIQKLPLGLPVALCGPEVSIRAAHFLERHPRITYVLAGEYEWTLLELVRHLTAGKDLSQVKGLVYRHEGKGKVNPARPLLENLDDLPWPLREGLAMEKYNDAPGGIPFPSVQMWSSRGCPYQCLFCSWPQLMYQSHRYRTRSVGEVVDEMEYLVKEKGFRSVYFDDDTMNIDRRRMAELAGEIKRRALNVPWAMMARADLMEEDILKHLFSAGLAAVKYGVESADQQLVDRINKKLDLKKLERMVRFTKSLGIKTHLTFTFGLPGETQETIQKTIEFAKTLDPDTVQFSITTAFPGTQYYKELETRGHIVSTDLKDYDGNTRAMLRTEELDAKELEHAKREAERIWQEHVWETRASATKNAPAGEKLAMTLKRKIVYPWVTRYRRAWRSGRPPLKIKKRGAFWLRRVCSRLLSPRESFRKIERNILNLMGVEHGSYAFKGPDSVQIDLTSNCNNQCISCWCNSPLLGSRQKRGHKEQETLSAPMAVSLIDDLARMGTNEIYFSGGGEPFMHPDLLSILKHAKNRKIHCTINTNFTLVDEGAIRQLLDIGVDALTVSFWAADAASYGRTHPGTAPGTFERMTKMLRTLNSAKNGHKPYVKIYNVISNLNYRELEKMVLFAEESGSEAVEFALVDTIPGATDPLILDEKQRLDVLAQCERISSGNHQVKVLNVETLVRRLSDTGAGTAEYDTGLFKEHSCYVGWVFSRILSNGDVNFCLKAHRVPVGNLYRGSFQDIWNSAKQREFRRKAVKFDKNDVFFSGIGNDEKCKVGCYKSCDDIGRNRIVQERLARLSFLQRTGLKALAKILALGR